MPQEDALGDRRDGKLELDSDLLLLVEGRDERNLLSALIKHHLNAPPAFRWSMLEE